MAGRASRIAAVQTTVALDNRAQGHHPQRIARYRLRPLDQSLSGLRAWLRLLLRATDPRLSRHCRRGLDFESKLFVKPDAPALLEKELAAADYEPRMIAIGTNTDPYQPIERERKIMRGILEVLERAGHPVGIVTKSALVVRDIDILARMAKRNLAKVAISVTTLDPKLARTMEPRASTPERRLEALKRLTDAGIPTTAMVAPVIPALNGSEIERILDAAAACRGQGSLLRAAAAAAGSCATCSANGFWPIIPTRYRHVFTLIRDMRGGRDYDSQWARG